MERDAAVFVERSGVAAERRSIRRAHPSREPFWTRLRRGGEEFDTYLVNDRFGIYALGFPVVSPLGHLVNLAELIVLASLTYVLLLAGVRSSAGSAGGPDDGAQAAAGSAGQLLPQAVSRRSSPP